MGLIGRQNLLLAQDLLPICYSYMRTSNPALNDNVFSDAVGRGSGATMTINGTVNRAGFLILLVFAAAWFSWAQSTTADGRTVGNPYIFIGAIGGFVVALITIFAKKAAPITSPIYAVLEGLFLGGISSIFESRFPGIAAQAIFATLGTLIALLIAYRSGLIKAT
jgi:uncharacterized YccA/Bax inhibitor family protein